MPLVTVISILGITVYILTKNKLFGVIRFDIRRAAAPTVNSARSVFVLSCMDKRQFGAVYRGDFI